MRRICLQNLERIFHNEWYQLIWKIIQDFLGTIKQKFAIGCGQSLEWIPLRDVEIQKGWVQHNSRRRFTSLFYSTKYTSSSKVSVFDKWFRARNEAEKWSFLKIWALEKKEVLETTKRGGVLVFTGQFYLQTGTTEALRHQQTENKWFRNLAPNVTKERNLSSVSNTKLIANDNTFIRYPKLDSFSQSLVGTSLFMTKSHQNKGVCHYYSH